MKIKLFLLASFIYIALIFAFAWHLELGSYTLNISTYTFELPIMIWLVIPLFIYMILSKESSISMSSSLRLVLIAKSI